MYKLGLIGTPLTHSFSKKYFDSKFKKEKIDLFSYDLFQLSSLHEIHKLFNKNIIGLNVTQPYKTKILNFLDELDTISLNTNSVNTIFINPKTNKKIGYNTDLIGFEKLLDDFDFNSETKALILGSGGSSNTISYYLNSKNIQYKIVSRTPKKNMINYTDVKKYIDEFQLIINTTPL